MKVVTIIGARPQFIKSAPVSIALQSLGIKEFTIHTGQHYDPEMSDVFFEEMHLPQPGVRLDCGNLDHTSMVGKMLLELAPILAREQPDYVLVYGDTNSTLAGALAATKMRIPLVHVEAGLRSFNMDMPEEMNRILTDRMSSLLFTPTNTADKNLQNEGFDTFPVKIVQVGDVMLDALHTFLPQSSYHSSMGELNIFSAPFVLATMHRFENVNDKRRLSELVEELNNVHHSLMPVWMPMHPSTVKKLKEHGLILKVHQGPPVSYLQMLWALEQCALVLTDSGGLQKEAFFMKRPCITLRNETEWVELLEIGANELFTSNDSNLAKSIERMTSKEINYTFDGYGSGNAAFQIAQTLLHHSK